MYEIQNAYQKSIAFAGEKHKDQKLPGSSIPYMNHLSNVAMEVLLGCDESFDRAFAVQVAILHDVLEDTDTEFVEVEECFGREVAEGVFALTKTGNKSKEELMKESIDKILKCSVEVASVKMADRITNLQRPPEYWTAEKIYRYKKEAEYILGRLGHCNKFLKKRLEMKINEYEKY